MNKFPILLFFNSLGLKASYIYIFSLKKNLLLMKRR